ncbi:CinA family protein [Leptothrix discophora]|uniref:CinA family protein n=1 Tax=Leptothrix discophora TaxID=89 RepID=A0ABT9G8V4_LEPDI|nr:CinA family protein [Leptothrix discophora]MDP4302924.1 CinA family protein [Leptothrix discophora]
MSHGPATSLDVGDDELLALAQSLSQHLLARGWMLACAESCTGGLIAATCTELSGSSVWLERGFVTYSNEAKSELLGVPLELIAQHGAVSEPVAAAMASGAAARSRAQVALSVTGIAGPTGGSPSKPVGTVWFGWSLPGHVHTEVRHFAGDRRAVRRQTVRHALTGLIDALR